MPCAREKVPKLVKRDCHYSISGVKGLLNSITMVNINVNIQNSPVNFEKLEDTKNNVVDVTESRGFGLLGVVEAAGPIDGDVSVTAVEFDGGADGPSSGSLAEVEEAVEDRAVLADVEAFELAREGDVRKGLGGDGREEVDVVVGVKAANVGGGGRERAVNLHAAVEGVVDDKIVRHADAVRLHWVALAVVVIADSWFVKVRDSSLFGVGT